MTFKLAMILLQSLLLFCLIVAATCRHQYHNQFNLLWETDQKKDLYSSSEQFQLENRFERLEHELELLAEQPYFGQVNNKSRVNSGEVAYLPCRVKFLQEGYMVTWLRSSDSTVLSVGSDTFSSDQRLSVVHVNRPQINADDWTLIINKTSLVDSGRYECSVNTLPKISHTVDLAVRDSMDLVMQDSPALSNINNWEKLEARILGPSTQYVSEGSTVALQCSIGHVRSAPSSLYWTREGRVFTARERPGTSLESEKVVDTSSTKLFISHVKVSDSGNYSCISDIARPASVQLVVSEALPGYALMFHNNSRQVSLTTLSIFIVSILGLRQHF